MLTHWRWPATALLLLAIIAIIACLTADSGDGPRPAHPGEVEAIAQTPDPNRSLLETPFASEASARVEVERAEVVTGEDGAPHVMDALLRARVIAGRAARDEVGPDYDSLIQRIAKERLVEFSPEEREGTIAGFCGFGDWEALQVAIGEAETNSAKRSALLDLLDKAAGVTEALERRLNDCWEDGHRLEIFDPKGVHNSKAWIEARGLNGDKGNLRMSRAARVGDRQFCLHFSSADYPGLDYAVSGIREQAKAYSESWR